MATVAMPVGNPGVLGDPEVEPWWQGEPAGVICPLLSEAEDPFDDFEDDDFDDEFDDDFEEDWEDDLTQDEEFPDTFGGADDDKDDEDKKASPFKEDPDFDD